MVLDLSLLGIISMFAVITPAFILLILIRGVKAPALRKMTLILVSFGIFHGIYHLLLVVGLPNIANPIDLITVLLLILLGAYYSAKVR